MKKLSLLVLLILVGCTTQTSDNQYAGRVLLWHNLATETEQTTLNGVIQRFEDIYEDVHVIVHYIDRDDMLTTYQNAASTGLGPNLLLGQSEWVRELAEDELIVDLSAYELRTDIYFASTIATLQYNNGLYGLPFSMRPIALYYNTELVETPAATLDELLQQATNGNRVAINTQFDRVFWGTQAFGGTLFDEDGRTILNEGGFTNWLTWLREAQESPNVFLSRDEETLIDLFERQQVAYMVATPDVLTSVQNTLGEEMVGVAPLPAGPVGNAGPLLRVDALMLNTASSQNQLELGLLLATFLTNAEQGGVFVRETQMVPANRRVRVDPVAYSAVAGFRAQAQTAIPIPNTPQMARLLELGDTAITQVLEGVVTEAEVAQQLTAQVNDEFGFESTVVAAEDCQLEGELVIWHGLEGEARDALEAIADNYQQRCTQVTLTLVAEPDTLLDDYLTGDESPPDIVLGRANWLPQLLEENIIQPTNPDNLQVYLARAVTALTVDDQLYGIPFFAETDGLYYNPSLVENPATTLEELRIQVQEQGIGLAMPTTFEDLYWGFTASGGRLLDENGAFTFDVDGWRDWLTWLDVVGETENVYFDRDVPRLRRLFADEEVAYFVGSPNAIVQFEASMGSDGFAVTTLPSGFGGEAQPILQIGTFFIDRRIQENNLPIAVDFTTFATNIEQQTLLSNRAAYIPANTNLVFEPDNLLNPWLEQVDSAVLLPNTEEVIRLRTRGSNIIQGTAHSLLDAEQGLADLAALFDVSLVETEEAAVTEEGNE